MRYSTSSARSKSDFQSMLIGVKSQSIRIRVSFFTCPDPSQTICAVRYFTAECCRITSVAIVPATSRTRLI